MERLSIGLPTGVVLPYAGTVQPEGFLFCHGQSLSRAAYPGLFSVIGTAHGAADASSFNLPDYRGRFLRGVDGAAGVDPDKAGRTAMKTGGATGDNVGSVQGHAFQTHTHIQNSHNHTQNPHTHYYYVYNGPPSGWGAGAYQNNHSIIGSGEGGMTPQTATNNPTTATNQNASASGAMAQASSNESRPVNAYVNYIIKV